jgi:hypothetical protein
VPLYPAPIIAIVRFFKRKLCIKEIKQITEIIAKSDLLLVGGVDGITE